MYLTSQTRIIFFFFYVRAKSMRIKYIASCERELYQQADFYYYFDYVDIENVIFFLPRCCSAVYINAFYFETRKKYFRLHYIFSPLFKPGV